MVHELVRRAEAEGTPLIDGDRVTFVWHGRRAPGLVGDLNDWDTAHPLTLDRLASGVWAYSRRLPADSYVEYAYLVGGQPAPDPWNRHPVANGAGRRNSSFYMPQAGPTPLARRRRGVPQGSVVRHLASTGDLVVGHERAVFLYSPPAPGPWPLLVVWDGGDYLHRARLDVIADNLIAQGRLPPLAMAFVAGGGRARTVEYACSEATVAFLLQQVLPLARASLDLQDPQGCPAGYGIMGASLGGLMALYTALRVPAVFGRVLSQSGAFTLDGYETIVYSLARQAPARPRVWMDVGRFEGLRVANRRLYEVLAGSGYDVEYHEYDSGHNYPAWRDHVWRGLEALFGH